ncbi:cell wall-binding repeat-containing protein [Herbiconiux sp. P16]|uniref:cell wall-binding repeat-containing protein n=1 Tax=Herbiconiux wuyangfengii TaxID=3342794 RepID=UPI0035B7BC31
MAAAVTLAVTGVAGPAAASAPSTGLVAQSKHLTATWTTGYSFVDADSLHVDLPTEIVDYGIDSLTWSLDGYSTPLGGTLAAAAPSFDVALPDGIPSGIVELLVTGTGAASGDYVRLQDLLQNSVPGAGSPVPTVAEVNLDLSHASREIGLRYTGDAAPAVLTPGSTLSLTAPAGFWTDGPGGVWKDTGSYGDATVVDSASGNERQLSYGVAFDGSALVLDIPTDLSGFESGTLRVTIWQDLGGADRGTTLEFSIAATLDQAVQSDRIDGANRYDVAVNVSKKAYPEGAPVAYLVTGENFPDALSAGPAAAADGGPLLLNTGSALLPQVETELKRLAPAKIVVVGGPSSVPNSVVKQLQSISPTDRVAGADRYEVSRKLLAYAFPDGAQKAFVATGANFPDALSAGAAAGSAGAPVVLVNGGASALDPLTKSALQGLGLDSITLVGGPNSVSEAMSFSLASVAETTRYGGADRYEASANLNAAAFDSSSRAFLVTGLNFPDALSGSAWAGAVDAPLYVTRPDCVPAKTLSTMGVQGVKSVTLIGGPASLTQSVFDLTACPPLLE